MIIWDTIIKLSIKVFCSFGPRSLKQINAIKKIPDFEDRRKKVLNKMNFTVTQKQGLEMQIVSCKS